MVAPVIPHLSTPADPLSLCLNWPREFDLPLLLYSAYENGKCPTPFSV